MGTIPRPKGFPIERKKHMKELKNKFDMGFNEINVIISPSLPSIGTILNNGTWASPTILGSIKGQYTYREFNPLLTFAT
jgi:hypothetical protein